MGAMGAPTMSRPSYCPPWWVRSSDSRGGNPDSLSMAQPTRQEAGAGGRVSEMSETQKPLITWGTCWERSS